ncbi:MAG: imelysin family protein [Thiohalocapsa sp.]|nr:imelysin family protein [Thiohalocapsa sp.]
MRSIDLRTPRRLAAAAGLMVCALVTVSPGPARADAPAAQWQAVNRAIVQGHVLPRYAALARATSTLQLQTVRFCADPRPSSLRFLRRAYALTAQAWADVEHLSTGPVMREQRRYRIRLWPDKHGTAAKQIRALLASADSAALEPQAFRGGSVAVQGLTAMERLLFPVADVAAEDFAGGDEAAFRCALLRAIGDNLADIAASVADEWESGAAADAGARGTMGETGGSARDAAAGFLRDLSTGLEALAMNKLERPLGPAPATARPKRAEAWRSDLTLQLLRANLASLQHLYMTGFSPVLTTDPIDGALDLRIRAAFTAALAAAALDQPLPALVGDAEGRARAQHLLAETRALQVLIGTKLPEALNLPLGFNSLDGD